MSSRKLQSLYEAHVNLSNNLYFGNGSKLRGNGYGIVRRDRSQDELLFDRNKYYSRSRFRGNVNDEDDDDDDMNYRKTRANGNMKEMKVASRTPALMT